MKGVSHGGVCIIKNEERERKEKKRKRGGGGDKHLNFEI